MPRKKKPKPSTALTVVTRHDLPQSKRTRNTGERVLGTTRAAFLKAYEAYGGNITKACQIAGIHRRTFYRWQESTTRINLKFQKRLAAIRPDDILIDAAELTIASAINDGDVDAAKFTLKTKGRKRGWSEKPDVIVINTEVLDRVAQAYQAFLSDHPELTFEDKWKWLVRFANGAKEPVEPEQLAKKVGIQPQG